MIFVKDFDGNLIELMDLGYMYHVLRWLGPLGGWIFRRGILNRVVLAGCLVHPAQLSITQTGSQLGGRARFFAAVHEGAVTGTVSGSNVAISGTLRSEDGDSSVEISDWATQLTDEKALAGTFVLDSRFGNAFGAQHLVMTCTLQELRSKSNAGP